jgi:hypothetical protein
LLPLQCALSRPVTHQVLQHVTHLGNSSSNSSGR